MRNSYVVSKKRIFAALIAICFIFSFIAVRLAYIQLIWGKELQSKALDQWTRDVPIQANRGDFYDSQGRLVATSVISYSIYVRAKNVVDANAVSRLLSETLDLNYNWVYTRANNKGVSEVTIARQVSKEKAEIIILNNFDGIYVSQDSTREYLYGDLLTQVLGFVSIDNVGQTGLEAQYDKYLKGIDGQILTQTDLIGIEQSNMPAYYLPAIDGLDVTLTIDLTIQQVVENVLEIIMKGHSPKRASAIVMDCTNGEILALGSKPSFDLNNIPRDDIQALMEYSRNSIVTDVYEPGSTFKVLTSAANLEEARKGNPNAFNASHIFRNNLNYRNIDGSKISCWTNHNNGKHHNQTLSDALNHSCNPIFTDMALSLGKSKMYDYLSAFGYGKVSGIDFAGEQAGILVNENLVTNSDLARIGFGQTIAVTPLQLLNATIAAVNGGILYQPHLVKSINYQGTVVQSFPSTVLSKPISSSTSKELALMLEDVVTNGSGKQTYIQGYEVGGKTGTAQKYIDGAVSPDKTISSFVGFFPASSPKYAVLIVVDEPVGIHYGSQVAAPYAKIIFQQIINYKDIKPTKY